MKTKMLFLVLCVTISTLYAASVDSISSLTIIRQDSSSVYVVNYSGSKIGTFTFTITDDQQNVMVIKTFKNLKDFITPINFSSMAEGIYYVQIDNGVDKQIQSIDYACGIESIFKHITSLGEHRYMVQIFHPGIKKSTITIYDGSGAMALDQQEIIKGQLNMVFNLSNVMVEPSVAETENLECSIITK